MGDYSEIPPEAADTAIYVRADAAADGADGSRSHPFPTILQAIDEAPTGGWVVVARGEYDSTLSIDRSVHLIGRCAASVRLAGVTLGVPTVAVRGAGIQVDLRGLTISGRGRGIHVQGGAQVALSATLVTSAVGNGIYIQGDGSLVEARGVWIAATEQDATLRGGEGIVLDSGGDLVASGLAMSANHEYGIVLFGSGASLRADNVAIDGTIPRNDGTRSVGVLAKQGSIAALTGVVVRGGKHGVIADAAAVTIADSTLEDLSGDDEARGGFGGCALSVSGGRLSAARVSFARCGVASVTAAGDGRAIVSASIIRDSRPSPGGHLGVGVSASASGQAEVEHTIIAGGPVGATARDEGSVLRLSDTVIRGGTEAAASAPGYGVTVEAQGRAELAAVRIDGRVSTGLAVIGTGSSAAAQDLVVTGTLEGTGLAGSVSVVEGAQITLTRARLEANVGIGINVRDAHGEATDMIVRDTQPIRRGVSGEGVRIDHGEFIGRRLFIERNRSVGCGAIRGAHVTLEDSVVREMLVAPQPGIAAALATTLGGVLNASRMYLADNVGDAVHSEDVGSAIELADALIEGTLPAQEQKGTALSGIDGGSVTARRVLVLNTLGRGAVTEDGGELHLINTTITGRDPDLAPAAPLNSAAVSVQIGGLAVLEGCVLNSNTGGVFAIGAGARARISRTMIGNNRERRIAAASVMGGDGVSALDGADVDVVDTYLFNDQGTDVLALGVGTRVHMRDVLIADVQASMLGGLGFGVLAVSNAAMELERVAVVHAQGAAVGASPLFRVVGRPTDDHARLTGADIFVLDTRPQFITPVEAIARSVAYGIHAGTGCVTSLSRVVVSGGQWGVFASGSLTIRDGVIQGQTQAAGARRTLTTDVNLPDVAFLSNFQDQVVVSPDLPEVQLAPPAAPCSTPPCP